ncbi:MAG: 30S ribosomal protein S5 [Candidatus Paceibacterota bacterium]
MTDEIKKDMPMGEGGPAEVKVEPKGTPAQIASGRPAKFMPRTDAPRGGDSRPKNPRKSGRSERPRSEFEQKMLNIRRVARVATGGRRFSFSVAMVAGDKKGKVGVGLGKANDTSLAIDKALRQAKKNMITVNMTKSSSIAHEVDCKYSSARIVIRPAPGRGVVAGSAVRNVLDLAGVKDVTAKILSGSKNKLNIARAAVEALSKLKPVKTK